MTVLLVCRFYSRSEFTAPFALALPPMARFHAPAKNLVDVSGIEPRPLLAKQVVRNP
jgi:hypothetical protein